MSEQTKLLKSCGIFLFSRYRLMKPKAKRRKSSAIEASATPFAAGYSRLVSAARGLVAGTALIQMILLTAWVSHTAHAETLRVTRTAIPPSRGIPFTAVSQPGVGIWSLMYDTLTRIDNGGNVEPALAVSWTAESSTRWVFDLRPDVLFQNGEAFTAEAVVASIEFLRSDEGSRFYTASEVQNIAAVEALDPLKVAIETERPDPILHRRANLLWILPPQALKDRGIDSFSLQPIGSGPFRLVDWGDTTGATQFEAFSESWRAPPEIEELTIYLMQDPITRLQALRSGQVDVAEQLSFEDVGQLSKDEFQLYERIAPGVSGIAFRVIGNESSPVADKRVRQAMNLAINRELIVDQLFQGSAVAAGQGAAHMVNGHNPDIKPWPYDPERARELLKDANFDPERTIKIHVAAGVAGNDTLLFQIVAQSLQAIGIKVELRSIPYAKWLTSFLTNEWGDADAFSLSWDNSAYFDAIRAETYTGCYKAQPFFCAPETRPLFEAISVEMDAEKRRALLQQFMAQLHDIAPAIWLVTGTEYAAAALHVRDLTLTSRGIPYNLIKLSKVP